MSGRVKIYRRDAKNIIADNSLWERLTARVKTAMWNGEGENATEDSDDETEDELDEQDKELKKRDHVTELDVT